jgi:type IV pilus assembly protein PilE
MFRDRGCGLRGFTVVPRRSARSGFTLIELMIVVVVVAILAVLVLPSYQGYVMKARRTDAKAALTTAAQSLERFATENPVRGYTDATVSDTSGATVVAKRTTDDGHYLLIPSGQTVTTYVLSATPQNSQLNDACKTFTLNQRGDRGVSADATKPARECWQ